MPATANSPHLEAFVGQGSSVEGLLIVWFQFQSDVAVLLGFSEPLQLHKAQRSGNTHTREMILLSKGDYMFIPEIFSAFTSINAT